MSSVVWLSALTKLDAIVVVVSKMTDHIERSDISTLMGQLLFGILILRNLFLRFSCAKISIFNKIAIYEIKN